MLWRWIREMFRRHPLETTVDVTLTDPAAIKAAEEANQRARARVEVLEERARVALRQNDRAST